MKPLDGIRVLDLTRLLPGAVATMTLVNFGAAVLKIEQPGSGDYARSMPPLLDGIGAYFWMTNLGKQSLGLDLKSDEGKSIFLQLVTQSDVVVEGFRPGVMDRLGLGYAQLSKENPRLICVSISGYGQTGPYSRLPGHDLNYAALSGVLSALGGGDFVPQIQLADIASALQAVIGVLLALAARSKTNRGQYIDISMVESTLPFLTVPIAERAATNSAGNKLISGRYACYNIYTAKDGRKLALAALEEKFWAEFCRAIGRPEFIRDHLTADKQPDLIKKVSSIFSQRTAADWLQLLSSADTCITQLNSAEHLFSDPQLNARDAFVPGPAPTELSIPYIGVVPKLSATPGTLGERPPRLGEHTRKVLLHLGYEETKIDQLADSGLVQLAD